MRCNIKNVSFVWQKPTCYWQFLRHTMIYTFERLPLQSHQKTVMQIRNRYADRISTTTMRSIVFGAH